MIQLRLRDVYASSLVRVVSMVLLWSLCVSKPVWAGGFWVYEIATPDMGVAAAGRAAAAKDASTAFGNPAGMTRLDQSQLLVGLEPIIASVKFDPGSGSTVAGSDGGDAGGFTPGGAVYYVHSVSPRLKLGGSLGGFVGGALDYDDDWVGRYFATEVVLTTVAFVPTIGYQVNDWLSIGGGPTATYAILKQEAAINNVLDVQPDGLLKIEDQVFALGGIFGILVEPWRGTRFGVQYTTQVDLSFEDVAETEGLGPLLEAALGSTGVLGSTADLDISLPNQVMGSVYHDVTDRLALMGNVGWQEWSAFGKSEVTISASTTSSITSDRNFKDTWHGAIGAQYRCGAQTRTRETGTSMEPTQFGVAPKMAGT